MKRYRFEFWLWLVLATLFAVISIASLIASVFISIVLIGGAISFAVASAISASIPIMIWKHFGGYPRGYFAGERI